jgi:hypothetical protein
MIFARFIVCVVLFSILCANTVHGKKEKAAPNKRDLPGISCASCQAVSYVMHDYVKQMYTELTEENRRAKAKSSRYKKKALDENHISEALDGVCNPDSDHGEWLRHYDITEVPVAEGDERKALTLEWHEEVGKCGIECRTIALSCQNLLNDDIDDRDELQEILYRNKLSSKELVDKVCRSLTPRCTIERTLAPGYSRFNEEFTIVDEKELEMERLLEEMKASGLGSASAYSRDDMAAMAEEMINSPGYDDYDDEDGPSGEF